jgi:hypothetical protein
MYETERYRRAQARVKQLRDFYGHLTAYVFVNLLLLAINLVTSPGAWWFYWPAFGWGIGLAAHALNVYAAGGRWGRAWEERTIRELLERE